MVFESILSFFSTVYDGVIYFTFAIIYVVVSMLFYVYLYALIRIITWIIKSITTNWQSFKNLIRRIDNFIFDDNLI